MAEYPYSEHEVLEDIVKWRNLADLPNHQLDAVVAVAHSFVDMVRREILHNGEDVKRDALREEQYQLLLIGAYIQRSIDDQYLADRDRQIADLNMGYEAQETVISKLREKLQDEGFDPEVEDTRVCELMEQLRMKQGAVDRFLGCLRQANEANTRLNEYIAEQSEDIDRLYAQLYQYRKQLGEPMAVASNVTGASNVTLPSPDAATISAVTPTPDASVMPLSEVPLQSGPLTFARTTEMAKVLMLSIHNLNQRIDELEEEVTDLDLARAGEEGAKMGLQEEVERLRKLVKGPDTATKETLRARLHGLSDYQDERSVENPLEKKLQERFLRTTKLLGAEDAVPRDDEDWKKELITQKEGIQHALERKQASLHEAKVQDAKLLEELSMLPDDSEGHRRLLEKSREYLDQDIRKMTVERRMLISELESIQGDLRKIYETQHPDAHPELSDDDETDEEDTSEEATPDDDNADGESHNQDLFWLHRNSLLARQYAAQSQLDRNHASIQEAKKQDEELREALSQLPRDAWDQQRLLEDNREDIRDVIATLNAENALLACEIADIQIELNNRYLE